MSGVRRRRLLLSGLLSLSAAGVLAQALQGSAAQRHDLVLTASTWACPHRPIEGTLEQSGTLAGRHLAVRLFVDENEFARITTRADRTRVTIPLPPLTPGPHLLLAKVGTQTASTGIRILSWSWAGAAAVSLIGAGGMLYVLLRRRRRPA